MSKRRKAFLWFFAGLSLLVAIASITFSLVMDGSRLKEMAREKAREDWSRELLIGEIELQFFPSPKLHAKNVTLSNPEWARDKYLIDATDMQVEFAILPLLTGKVEVSGIRFEGLKANFNVASDGRHSWDFPPREKMSSFFWALSTFRAQSSRIRFSKAQDEPVTVQVQKLNASSQKNLRDVEFDMLLERENYLLQIDGKIDDLSMFGQHGAVSKGVIHAKSGQAFATASGNLPLDIAMSNFDMVVEADASSTQELLGFLGTKRGIIAPLNASVTLHTVNKVTDFSNLKLQLGKLNLSGSGQLNLRAKIPTFNAQVQADHVDMIQTFLDAGRAPFPPKQADLLFRDNPLAWRLLVAMNGFQGKVDANIASLKMRSGIEVTDASAKMSFSDDHLTVNKFSGKLLGGTAAGIAFFDGSRKAIQLNLQMQDATLEQWFKQTGKNVAVSGGKMKVDAKVTAMGLTMNDLAATLTGPVDIQIGPAKIFSPNAGRAEFWLTGLFSSQDSDSVNLACASARLPFNAGLAEGHGIVGARSDASQLLTRGYINLRDQTVDLHGRVRARSGVSLGISTFANEVQIAGPVVKPRMSLDESGVVGAIARVGAAIFTGGLSVVATSLWDGANPQSDPCQQVFSAKARSSSD